MSYCACMIIPIALAVCVYSAVVQHALVSAHGVAEGLGKCFDTCTVVIWCAKRPAWGDSIGEV